MDSESLIQAIAQILWADGPDTEWDSETTAAIAGLFHSERPELVPPEDE